MHTYIDESGTFVPSAHGIALSLVGALTIPEGRLANVEKKYAKIRAGLPKERGEVKGRLLEEPQVARIVDLLRKNEVLLELVGIDPNSHTPADIEAHRAGQARGATAGLTDAHHPNIREYLARLGDRIAALNDQLYLQSVALFDLIWQTCEHAITYYAQRRPEALGAFHWTIDAKDKRKTNWEALWADIVMPILQSRSIRQPHGFFVEGDYRYFQRFQREIPEWLPKPEGAAAKIGTDIRLLLMEHFRYSSASEFGLELVDIVTGAARRALTGNLKRSGWAEIPALMIHRKNQYIHLIALHDRGVDSRPPYSTVLLKYFTRGGRPMLAPRFQD